MASSVFEIIFVFLIWHSKRVQHTISRVRTERDLILFAYRGLKHVDIKISQVRVGFAP